MKYLPQFPERFGSLAGARDIVDRFVQADNDYRGHSGIGSHSPADVHLAMTGHVADKRLAALQAS